VQTMSWNERRVHLRSGRLHRASLMDVDWTSPSPTRVCRLAYSRNVMVLSHIFADFMAIPYASWLALCVSLWRPDRDWPPHRPTQRVRSLTFHGSSGAQQAFV
jgi:hypothetical protein